MTTMPTTTDPAPPVRWWRGALAGLALCAAAGAQAVVDVSPTQVYVRRTSDTVVVRRAADGSERTLYSHDGARVLEVGDEVEQGSSGRSDWVLPGGGVVSMGSSGHGVVAALGAQRDWLRFPYVTRLSVTSQSRPLAVMLGSSLIASFEGTTIKVTRDGGIYTIRNEGGTPVKIGGDLVHRRELTEGLAPAPDPRVAPTDPVGSVTLGVAEEIRVPVREADARGKVAELWGDLPVRHDGEVVLEPNGDALVVTAGVQEPRRVSIGGVSLIASRNDALVVRRLRPRPAGRAGPPADEQRENNPENEP